MKKLYRKGTIHPSPPVISDQLSFLPAAVLTLTTALSPEEREVLAYLISCSNNSNNNNASSSSSFQGHQKSAQQQKNGGVSFAKSKSTGNNNINDHPPFFTCNCFRCYMSYWVKWDASPNRQLIHEIIDAFEDHEMLDSTNKKVKNNKKDKKKRSNIGNDHQKNDHHHHHQLKDQQILAAESESVEGNYRKDDGDNDIHEGCNNNKGEEGEEKGSVRSFVSYIGERIWGVWG